VPSQPTSNEPAPRLYDFVGNSGKAFYKAEYFTRGPNGEAVPEHSFHRYLAPPPFVINGDPPSPPEFVDRVITVRDEISGQFVPIPPGFSPWSPGQCHDDDDLTDGAEDRSFGPGPDDDDGPGSNEGHPLGGYSPDPGADSTPLGTDYEKTKIRDCKRKRDRGQDYSDTERDNQEDKELREDIVESSMSRRSGRAKKVQRRKGKEKGHALAADGDWEGGEVHLVHKRPRRGEGGARVPLLSPIDEEVSNAEQDGAQRKKPGPWPNEAKQKCEEFGVRVVKEAKEIGALYGKDQADVLMRAGLGFHFHRNHSDWQKFQVWFNDNYDMPSKCKQFCLLTAISNVLLGTIGRWQKYISDQYDRFNSMNTEQRAAKMKHVESEAHRIWAEQDKAMSRQSIMRHASQEATHVVRHYPSILFCLHLY
jgi:hypothetical protein